MLVFGVAPPHNMGLINGGEATGMQVNWIKLDLGLNK